MLNIIIGALVIVAAVISVLIARNLTPSNLRGFYGNFYWLIAALAIVVGAYLIISNIVVLVF